MNNNAWFKKENPLLSLQSMSGGAAGALMQGAADKTYVDDVFSTYVYKGDSSTRSINNGIDLSGEGGMVWIKARDNAQPWVVGGTGLGDNSLLCTNNNSGKDTGQIQKFKSLTSTGFEVGNDWEVNNNTLNYTSFSFRKAPGFFDVVTYTGNGSANRQISHSLKSIPGLILIKRTNGTASWVVYHRSTGDSKGLYLNSDSAAFATSNCWNSTEPTASVFTVGNDTWVNANNDEFVAYLFAGGASTAATARSVGFYGNNDYLSLESNSELAFGTGDFTIEFWVKMITDQYTIFFDMRPNPAATQGVYPLIYLNSGTSLRYFTDSGDRITGPDMTAGNWYHIAVSRSGTSTRMFLNGTQVGSTYSDSNDYVNGDTTIGCRSDGSTGDLHGYMSNVRVVKGTALYTSSFRPPTEPLTNITNTKLLCCNNSSTTGSTVTPGTITATGSPTATTNSPFDDLEGFKFGEGGDQNIIKTGSYIGTGSATHRKIELGFEPQWIMTKRVDGGTSNWDMADMMRGTPANDNNATQNGPFVWANQSWAEATDRPFTNHSTGFGLKNTSSGTNGSGDTYVYIAIRRPDGYVGKPAEAGTDAITMDTGSGSSTIPNFDSTFPVDFAFAREPSSTGQWDTGARLIQGKYLGLNSTADEATSSDFTFDSNVGWNKISSWSSSYQSWMWKRGAGMDVVCWTGNGSARKMPHSLSKTPEMIWVKKRWEDTSNWPVYHKGLNGGTNPEQYYINLDEDSAENTNSGLWNDIAPTSTHFSLGTSNSVSENTHTFIAMLFSSVAGISKVGSYSGANSEQTITLGFQPRFVIIRSTSGSRNWIILDTARGWASGNDAEISINKTDAQSSSYDFGAPTATGFTINYIGNDDTNASGHTYIYYAHA